MHTTEAAGIAPGSIDSERAVNVSASLIELDGLPRVLRRLADPGAIRGHSLTVCLVLLILNVPLDLILAESEGQIQLEGLIILPGLGLLETRLVAVRRVARASLSGAARVLRAVIVAGAIGGRGRRRGEEARLRAGLVGGLVHLGLHILGLADRISELHDQIMV